jgi:hypothetical protein
VKAYVRYVKGWATIPNTKCSGQNEIDLLAIDPATLKRYHIEVSVHITGGLSKLTNKAFDPDLVKERVQMPKQRRTLGFFIERKFRPSGVRKALERYGFREGEYNRIIVTWGWTDDVPSEASAHGIELWDFRTILSEIAGYCSDKSHYFSDDTLRTLRLFCLGEKQCSGE